MTPRCCKLLSRGALARALRALAGRFPFRRGAPSCFPVLSRTPDASWGSFEGLLASGVPPGSLLGASWAPSWGPRASKSAPKAPRKPTKSGQERPKSAPRGPKQPQATRSFIFDRFGSPFRLDFWSPGASKISKKCRTVVKNQGFRGLARGRENGPKKPKNEPPKPPRPARNLPREKTESGVSRSSCCNRVPRCVLRLSGGSTVKLPRFFVVWWSRGKSLAFSVVWWFCGKSLAFSVVWWLRGKFLKFSLVRRPRRKVQAVFA